MKKAIAKKMGSEIDPKINLKMLKGVQTDIDLLF